MLGCVCSTFQHTLPFRIIMEGFFVWNISVCCAVLLCEVGWLMVLSRCIPQKSRKNEVSMITVCSQKRGAVCESLEDV
jgi:hypothetical protein